MRGKTPTIYDIKAAVEETPGEHHFFERDTMRFFGQKLNDFKVKRSPKERIFIYAPSYWSDRGERRLMGYTFQEYLDGHLLPVYEAGNLYGDSENTILEYIAAH